MDKLNVNLLKNMGIKDTNPVLKWKNPYFRFITGFIGYLIFFSFFAFLIIVAFLAASSIVLNVSRGGGSIGTDIKGSFEIINNLRGQ